MVSVKRSLTAIIVAIALATHIVPSRESCEEETQSKLRESLLRYVRKGEYIVRFE